MIHATNAWNPTGHDMLPVPGTRLFYVHVEALSGPRTYVFLGSQQHLVFVADLQEHVAPEQLREQVIEVAGLYPHLVDPRNHVRDRPRSGALMSEPVVATHRPDHR